jgi:hypothetical protein
MDPLPEERDESERRSMRRCAELRLHPPKLWDGVFRLETK